jgi:hypothetical protein
MNIVGVTVYKTDLDTQSSSATVDVTRYAAGAYMVELSTGHEKITKRLVKE